MKLLLCKRCQDVIRLFDEKRTCKCGHSSGWYIDDSNAVYNGADAVPIGFANSTLLSALYNQPLEGMGKRFEAFVIPVKCPTYKRVKGTNGG